MSHFYLLDENKVPYEVSVEKCYKMMDMDYDMKVVGKDMVGDILVSTVFLGLDHSHYGQEGPILFETMIFEMGAISGEFDGFQRRYKTYDEAVEGHKEALEMVNNFVNNN